MSLVPHKNNAIPTVEAPILTIALVIGSRKDIGAIEASLTIQVRRKHFYPAYNREMKDVVIVGLPQKYRFMIMQDMEIKETPYMGYVILFISPEPSWGRNPW